MLAGILANRTYTSYSLFPVVPRAFYSAMELNLEYVLYSGKCTSFILCKLTAFYP